ncbi:acyltransferase family protein [Hydrogenophaga sp.]|uniref:acyltransferase family protein n=1 Tax=Hydrogenophaga sp. TaxID=1904254 RepID=UPI002601C175|nr:acyltransferase family protein [Hydrogenophaga sp.]MCW5654814.1 acyltransferase [Hydrogenophaga sp.]
MSVHPATGLSHPKYRPDIDGLRAVAVLSVVVFHAFPTWLRGGFIGVDIFFVISGFLISTILFENLDRGSFSFTEFYARRIRRIFPALLLVLVASWALGWFALLADEYAQLGRHIAAGAGFVSNFVLWNEVGYFDNTADTKPLLHLWSLAIEEQFYIVWPLALWLLWRWRASRPHLPLVLIVLAFAASFALNMKGVRQDAMATFYSPQTRFWELLSGSLLAWAALYRPAVPYAARRTRANVMAVLGLLLLCYGFGRIAKGLSFPGAWAAVPVLGAVLLIAAGPAAWVNRKVLAHPVLVFVGLISFPLYLWHWPLLSFARIVESGTPSLAVRLAAVALSLLLAWLTYRLVEQPLRHGGHGRAKAAGLLGLMLLVGLGGYLTHRQDGWPSRDAARHFVDNKQELVRTPEKDDACRRYSGLADPLFHYCRFDDAGSARTVALIGDSHAHVAFPGLAREARAQGLNTVLLANSGCPPFLDTPVGANETERAACSEQTAQILQTLSAREDVRQVFIFTRGPIYLDGIDLAAGPGDTLPRGTVTAAAFGQGAQKTVDALQRDGRQLFYVTENPELSSMAEACIPRPLRRHTRDCRPARAEVLQRQAGYRQQMDALRNVTVLDSLAVFCPGEQCQVFDATGALLYADDNHLSMAGSLFQARALLEPHLEK